MSPTVLYIAGYGRSGSTVLDMLLGTHPRIIGGGELTHLFHHWLDNEPCSCGMVVQNCPFWGDVMAVYQDLEPRVSFAQAAQITRQVEQRLNQRQPARNHPPGAEYGRIWQAVFTAIANVGQVDAVVDSSKSTRGASGRVLSLSRYAALDVRQIHMVRDPRAVMYSYLRGSNLQLENGVAQVKRGGAARMLLGWTASNVIAQWTLRDSSLPACRLRYEDLVLDTDQSLTGISTALDYDLSALRAALRSVHWVKPDHGIRGNRLRRKGFDALRLDDEWKTALPVGKKILAALIWPLARRYNY